MHHLRDFTPHDAQPFSHLFREAIGIIEPKTITVFSRGGEERTRSYLYARFSDLTTEFERIKIFRQLNPHQKATLRATHTNIGRKILTNPSGKPLLLSLSLRTHTAYMTPSASGTNNFRHGSLGL